MTDYQAAKRHADAKTDWAPWMRLGVFMSHAVDAATTREDFEQMTDAYIRETALTREAWLTGASDRMWSRK